MGVATGDSSLMRTRIRCGRKTGRDSGEGGLKACTWSGKLACSRIRCAGMCIISRKFTASKCQYRQLFNFCKQIRMQSFLSLSLSLCLQCWGGPPHPPAPSSPGPLTLTPLPLPIPPPMTSTFFLPSCSSLLSVLRDNDGPVTPSEVEVGKQEDRPCVCVGFPSA